MHISNKRSSKLLTGKLCRILLKASKKCTALKAASATTDLEENMLVKIDCSLNEFSTRISNDDVFEESLKLTVSYFYLVK